MNNQAKVEFDKLLQAQQAYEKARCEFESQFEVVNRSMKCPVCDPGEAKVSFSFGKYEIKCDSCGFHVGRFSSLKELGKIWWAVVDTIETKKTENE